MYACIKRNMYQKTYFASKEQDYVIVLKADKINEMFSIIGAIYRCEYYSDNTIYLNEIKPLSVRKSNVFIGQDRSGLVQKFKEEDPYNDEFLIQAGLELFSGGQTQDDNKVVLKTENLDDIDVFLKQHQLIRFENYSYDGNVGEVVTGKLTNLTKEDISYLNFKNHPFIIRTDDAERHSTDRIQSNCFTCFSENGAANDICNYDQSFVEWFNSMFWQGKDDFFKCNELPEIKLATKSVFFSVETGKDYIKISKIIWNEKREEDNNIYRSFSKNGELYIGVSGNGNHCHKYVRKECQDISPFEFFNVNKRTIYQDVNNFHFKNGEKEENATEWFTNNSEFCRKCGFFDFIVGIRGEYALTGLFIIYLCIIFDYPSVELLIKSGYMTLTENFLQTLIESTRKEIMAERVKELDKLIYANETKGSMVLRFPKYIGDYLKTTGEFLSYLKIAKLTLTFCLSILSLLIFYYLVIFSLLYSSLVVL